MATTIRFGRWLPLALGLLWTAPLLASPRLAILGDSLSTGGATHPALSFDAVKLYGIFEDQSLVTPKAIDIPRAERFHLESELPLPTRLWPAPREYSGGFEWVMRHVVLSLGQRYLDTEQYSWGYLTGNTLGIAPKDILIAADDGARTEQMARHYDRVLDATGGERPERIAIFYTGNDLCAQSLDFVPSGEDYRADLRRGLDYIRREGKAPAGGSDVFVMGFLGVLQLLYSPDILAKKVYAFGETVSCRDLRERGYRPKDAAYRPDLPMQAAYFAEVMPPNPTGFCPTLFTPHGIGSSESEKVIGDLANRIRDYREAQKAEVNHANRKAQEANQGIRFHYVESTANLIFKGEDIAGDCFHLSTSGQAMIAEAMTQAVILTAP